MGRIGVVASLVAATAGLAGAAAFIFLAKRKERNGVRRRTAVAGCSPHATPEWAEWVVKARCSEFRLDDLHKAAMKKLSSPETSRDEGLSESLFHFRFSWELG